MNALQRLTDEDLVATARRAVQALPDAPAAWQQRAMALMPAPGVGAVLTSGLRLLKAVLTFDSLHAPAAAGMRSGVAGAAATRHLLYSVEGRDIDLRIAPTGDTFALNGQVLGPDDAGTVELAPAGGSTPQQARLDDLGEFRIEGVERGSYVVTLRLSGEEILLPTLDVGG